MLEIVEIVPRWWEKRGGRVQTQELPLSFLIFLRLGAHKFKHYFAPRWRHFTAENRSVLHSPCRYFLCLRVFPHFSCFRREGGDRLSHFFVDVRRRQTLHVNSVLFWRACLSVSSLGARGPLLKYSPAHLAQTRPCGDGAWAGTVPDSGLLRLLDDLLAHLASLHRHRIPLPHQPNFLIERSTPEGLGGEEEQDADSRSARCQVQLRRGGDLAREEEVQRRRPRVWADRRL